MARGKHGNKTANREQAVLQREAPLRNEIARLTTRLEKADQANLAQQVAHIEETRKMRALIAANTSERLEEVEARIQDLEQERDLALATVNETADRWRKVTPKILDLIQGAKSCDREEAFQSFFDYTGMNPDGALILLDGEEVAARKHGVAGVQAMRRARRAVNNPMHLDYQLNKGKRDDRELTSE